MDKYYRICEGLTDKGFLVKEDELNTVVTDSEREWYASVFYYTEEHEEWKNGNQLSETQITYKDEARNTIVTKKIDYQKSRIHPDFRQEDFRDGSLEAAKTEGGVTELTYRKNRKKAIETKKIRIPGPIVIDGGFTNFVKDHWQDLEKGEKISFNFAVPSQLDYFAFRMFKAQEITFGGKRAVIYKMELDQPILRAIFPAVMLTYNMSSRRLMQYEGISNINDKKGKSYQVRIIYPDTGPQNLHLRFYDVRFKGNRSSIL